MNIAFITTSFPSLSETFILNQITGMIDLGHTVRIYSFRKGDDSVLHTEIGKYGLDNKVVFIPDIPIGKFKKRLLLANELIKKGFIHPQRLFKIIISCFFIKPFNYKAVLLALYFNSDTDATLCHFGYNAKLCNIAKKVGICGKLFTFFHGSDVTQYIRCYGTDIYKDVFTYSDLILPISDYFKNKLIQYGCPEEKTIVHHMGIDLRKFNYKQHKLNTPVKLLLIGRLTEKKGHKYAIEATEMLIKKGIDCNLIIAGDGEMRSDIEFQINKLQLESNVVILGKVDSDRVARLYDECDICLVPSVEASTGDMEGIPVVIMEAMAKGLPVIATKHSGIPEIVLNDETGFIVMEKDSTALHEKILDVLINYEDTIYIAEKGKESVEKEFNIKIQNMGLDKSLKKMVAR